jgi:hypothetical protein
MHPIKNYYFIGGSSVYLFIQWIRSSTLNLPPFINDYWSDFLFVPLLLFFTVWALRIIKRDQSIVISNPMLFFVWLFVSFIFEYYLPQKSTIYSSDNIDVFMYFLGTVSFYFLQKKID